MLGSASSPTRVMRIEMTMAITGLRMKKFVDIG